MEPEKIRLFFRRIKFAGIGLMMVLYTLYCATAAQAVGFNMFGYHVGTDGVGKEEHFEPGTADQVQARTATAATEQHSYTHRNSSRNRELTMNNISDALRMANSDKYTQNAMKEFAGDHYCILTEKRVAYFGVEDDGNLIGLNDEPENCYRLKTTEAYAMRLWEKVKK